jgi:hypothetical protein
MGRALSPCHPRERYNCVRGSNMATWMSDDKG